MLISFSYLCLHEICLLKYHSSACICRLIDGLKGKSDAFCKIFLTTELFVLLSKRAQNPVEKEGPFPEGSMGRDTGKWINLATSPGGCYAGWDSWSFIGTLTEGVV